jgi:aminoglycoside 6'-N-acetyltransferase
MNNQISFTPLCEDDLELLHKWFQVPHIKKWYARGETYSLETIREQYLPRIQAPASIPNFIIKLDEYPVGYIQMYRLTYSLPEGVDNYDHSLFSLYKPEEMAGIDLFIADENILRKGISSEILNKFIDEFIAGKFKATIVDPVKINATAISFFEKNGFKVFPSSAYGNYLLMMYII